MEKIILDIITDLKNERRIDSKRLQNTIHAYNRTLPKGEPIAAKRKLLPYYTAIKRDQPERWQSWGIDPALEKKFLQTIQMKPRRTASGVATITVITKPWMCSSNCLYCPNDVRMPKSYLSDEPACQRAELNFFDPYLQTAARLHVLNTMGHVTDKIELIVLGGTWNDYPKAYQTWFIKEVFRALNDSKETRHEEVLRRRAFYESIGLSNDKSTRIERTEAIQSEVTSGNMSFNDAISNLYLKNDGWTQASKLQCANMEELEREHIKNESGENRVVGLVIETQPDVITPQSLTRLRALGCTKVQIGIQTLNQEILLMNNRHIRIEEIQNAIALLRLFGFKIHIHFMANLYGSNPEMDKKDYYKLVNDPHYLPDEVKLYPCALIDGTGLCKHFDDGSWKPYEEDELIDILVYNTLATPSYVRISRMIRDFSSHDIKEGNKKINLRQLVEIEAAKQEKPISEIRYREISTATAHVDDLHLEILPYHTSVSEEFFLQWVTPENKIAGFLRLSLPSQDYLDAHPDTLPINKGEAMIREVHVYGKVASLHNTSKGAQHLGLGKQLIKQACQITRDAGYEKLNVISAIGTRGYYRKQGFVDNGLYQQLSL